jgi:hypothetical protein
MRGDQRKRLMGTAFPLADPSISGQLPGSQKITGKVPRAQINLDGFLVNRELTKATIQSEPKQKIKTQPALTDFACES